MSMEGQPFIASTRCSLISGIEEGHSRPDHAFPLVKTRCSEHAVCVSDPSGPFKPWNGSGILVKF